MPTKELSDLKRERKTLIEMYGNRGQKHSSASMIGGINPAAQRLRIVRGEIARIERRDRPERPVVVSKTGHGRYHSARYGLSHEVAYRGRRGDLGTDNFGKWYVIAGDDRAVVAEGLRTLAKARDAFGRWVDEGTSGRRP
jgi:hypothetical protein